MGIFHYLYSQSRYMSYLVSGDLWMCFISHETRESHSLYPPPSSEWVNEWDRERDSGEADTGRSVVCQLHWYWNVWAGVTTGHLCRWLSRCQCRRELLPSTWFSSTASNKMYCMLFKQLLNNCWMLNEVPEEWKWLCRGLVERCWGRHLGEEAGNLEEEEHQHQDIVAPPSPPTPAQCLQVQIFSATSPSPFLQSATGDAFSVAPISTVGALRIG